MTDMDFYQEHPDGTRRARIRRQQPDGTMGEWEWVDADTLPPEMVATFVAAFSPFAQFLGCICDGTTIDEACPVHGEEAP